MSNSASFKNKKEIKLMAKTISELYSPAERAEILTYCKIRIKYERS